jgi:hypothetical protein
MTYTLVWRNEARQALSRLRSADPTSTKLVIAAVQALAPNRTRISAASSVTPASGDSGSATSASPARSTTTTEPYISTLSGQLPPLHRH